MGQFRATNYRLATFLVLAMTVFSAKLFQFLRTEPYWTDPENGVFGFSTVLDVVRCAFWLPSIFLLDMVSLAMPVVLNLFKVQWMSILADTWMLFSLISVISSISFLLETGAQLDWNAAMNGFGNGLSFWTFVLSQSGIFFLGLGAFTLAFIFVRWLLDRPNAMDPIYFMPFLEDDHELDEESGYAKYRKRRRHSSGGFLNTEFLFHALYYLGLVLLFRPDQPWNTLSQSPLVSMLWGTTASISNSIQLTSGYKMKPPWDYPDEFKGAWNVSNFDLPRVVDVPAGGFKHVVVIALESARSDVVPFDPRTSLKRAVDEHFLKTGADITPFLRQLYSQSIKASSCHATSAYTIKSLLSILCGVYPLNANYNLESGFNIYQPCLPSLLAKTFNGTSPNDNPVPKSLPNPYVLQKSDVKIDIDYDGIDAELQRLLGSVQSDFASGFFQASDLNFDAQRRTMEKMGFDVIWGRDEIRRHFVDIVDETNYFGFSDYDVLPSLLRFVDHATARHEKRMFLTLLTAVSHHPWKLPWGETMETYSATDPTANSYLNTIRYTDRFIRDLMTEFRARGLDKETLFIFTGDHGIGVNHHNIVGSLSNPYETAFQVPLFYYSSNPGWKSSNFSPGQWNHMDIFPTILDALSVQNSSLLKLADFYEGQTLLRPYRNRVQFSFVSPGNAMVVARQDNYKAVYDIKSLLTKPYYQINPLMLFDVASDPDENHSLAHHVNFIKQNEPNNPILSWLEKVNVEVTDFSRIIRLRYGYLVTR